MPTKNIADVLRDERHEDLRSNSGEIVRYLEQERDKLIEAATWDIRGAGSNPSTARAVAIEEKLSEVSSLDLRIAQYERIPARVKSEPEVYRRDDLSVSFFRDLFTSAKELTGGPATDRLRRNRRMQAEKRSVDLNTTGGTGGEFAPPGWIVADWIELARPGRVTADLIGAQPLPAGVSSINIPKVSGGSGTGVQSSQGVTLVDTAATTTSVGSGVLTVAGKQTTARQLMDQSGIPLDRFIVAELALSYGASLNSQVFTAAASAPWQGGGLLNVSGAGSVAFTSGTPVATGAGSFHSAVLNALSKVATTRDLPATALVMHPRRWYWYAGSYATTNAPIVQPKGNAGLHIASQDDLAAAGNGPVGDIGGVPVYLDPSIPTNLGGGTNQDVVLALREADMFLWESGPTGMMFEAADAPSMGALYRVHGYAALIAHAQPGSICVVSGTGLVTPTIS